MGFKLLIVNPFSGGVAPTELCKPLHHWQTLAAFEDFDRGSDACRSCAVKSHHDLFRLCPNEI